MDYGCLSMQGDLLQKMIKSWSRKKVIDVKYTPQTKGERLEGLIKLQEKYQHICNRN